MSNHPFVHIEISANNLDAAGKFYAEAFGWNVQHIPEMNYSTFETGEGVGGGLNPVQEGVSAGSIVVYIGTDDIEASLEKIEKLGGQTIVPKNEIPGMGWFALFKYPTGNVIGLFTEIPMS